MLIKSFNRQIRHELTLPAETKKKFIMYISVALNDRRKTEKAKRKMKSCQGRPRPDEGGPFKWIVGGEKVADPSEACWQSKGREPGTGRRAAA